MPSVAVSLASIMWFCPIIPFVSLRTVTNLSLSQEIMGSFSQRVILRLNNNHQARTQPFRYSAPLLKAPSHCCWNQSKLLTEALKAPISRPLPISLTSFPNTSSAYLALFRGFDPLSPSLQLILFLRISYFVGLEHTSLR